MQQESSTFDFNPFAGIAQEDIPDIIVPRPEMIELLDDISATRHMLVEFLGKKGRGKTTHVRWLKENFPKIPLYLLNNGSKTEDLMNDPSRFLFVDSIHHLGLRQRIELFRNKDLLIYTSHYSRRIEAFFAGKSLIVIKFEGISPQILEEIIRRRLEFASSDSEGVEEALAGQNLNAWIAKYGDNYRGIINTLFDSYQQP